MTTREGTARARPVTTLFLDIGGVLLTDGWDRHARRRAAKAFRIDGAELEERHHITFETFEEGTLTLAKRESSMRVAFDGSP